MSTFDLIMVMLLPAMSLATSNWNQEARDYILEIHNDYRRGEGGCHVNKLVYDQGLEAQARRWAERCVFSHENIKGRGENLAFDSNEGEEKDLIKGSTQRWFDEKYKYNYVYGQYSCGSACHYTQMVWGKTSKVGCYTHRCPYLTNAWKNSWYLVCFYTPVGNWNGEKPYDKGCSSPCLDGQTEENGLCVGEGKVECVDSDPQCEVWAKSNQCSRNKAYMEDKCKKSCKICSAEATGGGAASDCVDDNPSCESWAKRNECSRNPSYMHVSCKKSCNKC